jgi:hypothetical protein
VGIGSTVFSHCPGAGPNMNPSGQPSGAEYSAHTPLPGSGIRKGSGHIPLSVIGANLAHCCEKSSQCKSLGHIIETITSHLFVSGFGFESTASSGQVGVGSASHISVAELSLVSGGQVKVGSFDLTLSLEVGLAFPLLLLVAGGVLVVVVAVAAEALEMPPIVGVTARIRVVTATKQTAINLFMVLAFLVCFSPWTFLSNIFFLLEYILISNSHKLRMLKKILQ